MYISSKILYAHTPTTLSSAFSSSVGHRQPVNPTRSTCLCYNEIIEPSGYIDLYITCVLYLAYLVQSPIIIHVV